MINPFEFLAIIACVWTTWYVVTSLKMRERANEIARAYCSQRGAQFLDASVGFGSVRPVWQTGKLKLKRVYVFAYSYESIERLHGLVIFVGGLYDNLVLLEEQEETHHE